MSGGVNRVFTDISGAVLALEGLVKPCYGPDGLQVLIEDGGGSRCGGFQLMASVHFKEPVCRLLLLQTLVGLDKAVGDGAKKFGLMLASMLGELSPGLQAAPDILAVTYVEAIAQMCIKLTKSVLPSLATSENCKFLCHHLPKSASGEPLLHMCRSLARTCLGGKCSPWMKERLLEMVSTLLLAPPSQPEGRVTASLLKERIESMSRNFEEVVTLLPNLSPSESRALPGFVVERDFAVAPSCLPLNNFKVVLLTTGIELDEDSKATYRVHSEAHLSSIMCTVNRMKEKLIQLLASRGVRLVLTGRRVDPASVQYCRAHSIGLIQMVPEDTLEYMAACSGTHPWSSALDLMKSLSVADGCAFLIAAKSCAHLTIGSNKFVHLQFGGGDDTPLCSSLPRCALLLCGNTPGQCRELAGLVKQVLVVLSTWLQEVRSAGREEEGQGGGLVALRGGGAWELAVAKELERDCLKQNLPRGSVAWHVHRAMQKAFLVVPMTLLSNSTASQSTGDSLRTLHMVLGNEGLKNSRVHYIVDAEQGCLQCVDDTTPAVWEPYRAQEFLVWSVCNLLKRVLSIDMVVKTPHPLALVWSRREQESDEELDPRSD